MSNYQAYPFPGGYVDQPSTWHRDRRLYMALRNRAMYVESENKRIEDEAKAKNSTRVRR